MRIFKLKTFNKWAIKNKANDELLLEAAKEASLGIVEAKLGGGTFKKRIATKGRGKSGSIRTIIAFETDDCLFYIFGFEKNEKENISASEKKALKLIAQGLFEKSKLQLDKLLKSSALIEVINE